MLFIVFPVLSIQAFAEPVMALSVHFPLGLLVNQMEICFQTSGAVLYVSCQSFMGMFVKAV